MADACIFCDIVAKKAPADIVHEDDDFLAFRDVSPSAPVHLLVVPKKHHTSLDSLSNSSALARLLETGKRLGQKHSPELGYRLGINSAGQADVGHVHLHVLGGLAKGQTAGELSGKEVVEE